MDPDEQKSKTKESKLFQRYKPAASHVFPTARIRFIIQDTLKCYWELLGYRYHILLLVRGILAALLGVIEIL
jgi:hypothetical protein